MGVTKLVFEWYKALKAKIKGVFNKLYLFMWGQENETNTCLTIIGHLFDTIILAAIGKNLLYYPVKV